MRLQLCGIVRLETDHPELASLSSAKALALLAYLSLEPGAHSRDELSSFLWGESTSDKARASLRQSIKMLRSLLGDHLEVDRATVALRNTVSTDVADFLAKAERGDEAAIDIDVPRFLDGLAIREAPPFEEWAERTGQSLRLQYRRALIAAARAASSRNDLLRALSLAQRWQQLDPHSEDAVQLQMEVLQRRGEGDAALAVFHAFRARRARDEDAPPGRALRELADRIARSPKGRGSAGVSSRVTPLPSFVAPMVGRTSEWEALLRAWQALADGEGGVVCIDGEAGTGKTRLVDDFARFVSTRDAVVLTGRAFESGLDTPFGPMLQILRGAIDAPGAGGTDGAWLSEVARIVPEMRRSYPSLPEPMRALANDGSLLHEGVAQLLLAVAEDSRVVVVLDDLQWCDADTCGLLHMLIERLRDQPILWCVTSTLGVALRDAPGVRVARALRAVPQHRRLRLTPLARDEVWQLIRTLGRVAHPDGGRRLANRVHAVTSGNPLYVIESLKTLFLRGWLKVHPESGEWLTTDIGASELAVRELLPDVRESVAERIAAVPDEEHALLLTIATTGSGCHTSLLSYVHGISRLRAAHVGDILVERHLVVETDGHYLCAHAVIASVVLESMSTSRRREVHRMIALALSDAASSVQRTADPGSIARHAAAGGELEMAHRFALLASQVCVERSAWDDALQWLDLATECARSSDELRAADEPTAVLLARDEGPPAPERRPVDLSAAPMLRSSDMDLHPSPPAIGAALSDARP